MPHTFIPQPQAAIGLGEGGQGGEPASPLARRLGYDAKNRLTSVTGPELAASFAYDGDGQRVLATLNGVTTVYIGDAYERPATTIQTHYHLGGQRVALRTNGTLTWLLTDDLGSTAINAHADGTLRSRQH